MIISVGIVTCLVAILGAARLTTAEYSRLRKSRQLRQATRRIFDPAFQV